MPKLYAKKDPNVSEREKVNGERARRIAAQGMVLLENNGSLPLQEKGGNIALYGNGARFTIKGGTGSGDVNSREVVNVEQALEAAGFDIVTKEWLDRYDASVKAAKENYETQVLENLGKSGLSIVMEIFSNPFRLPTISPLEEDDIRSDLTDTAIFVISRNSGEGIDRRPVEGQYYLYPEELKALREVSLAYENTILVLNVGGVIDMKAIKEIPSIDAILLMSQAGNYGGHALVDLLLGRETPSGHLTSSWPIQYEDCSMSEDFSFTDGNLDDEYYREGIYVGYRYYDSLGIPLQYPFGYGLSYTEFRMETNDIDLEKDQLRLQLRVINAGKRFAGRALAQLYVSAPQGKLDKPYQELKAYQKSMLLQPGQSEELEISFSLRSLASYDSKRASWILEPGDYLLRLGEHSRNTHVIAKLHLDEEIILEKTINRLPLDIEMEEMRANPGDFISYAGEQKEIEQALLLDIDADSLQTRQIQKKQPPVEIPRQERKSPRVRLDAVKRGEISLEDFIAQLSEEELAYLCVGAFLDEGAVSGPQIGASSTAVPGAAGDTTALLIDDCGVRNLVTADGPAGLRLMAHFKADRNGNVLTSGFAIPGMEFLEHRDEQTALPADAEDYYQYTTAIPIATLLAQTWDPKLLEAAGDIVGQEMELFGVDLWLAPGMNIHRAPLCGRNFEYFSEDPLISGICAAAETRGVQKHKSAGTTIKHFAFNNQEDNRNHVSAHVSERASREIYLKGFEIAVKEAQPFAIMTSYNLINGEHTANSYDLLTGLAREEWGFEGIVMTDWGTTGDLGNMIDSDQSLMGTKYGDSYASGCIKAGNDLIMPGAKSDVTDILDALGKKEGEHPYPLTLAELQDTARHMLSLILRMER